jgi:hypothetical protein
VDSIRLSELEMRGRQDINDREKKRRRVGFRIHAALRPEHSGGRWGQAGPVSCSLLRRAHVTLVNLGMRQRGGPLGFSLFPVCTVCGALRSPGATQTELDRFSKDHRETCGPAIARLAHHVDMVSDILRIGPFPDEAQAVNLREALLIGAGLVLNMGDHELEGYSIIDEAGSHWTILCDPVPGGAGFLDQMIAFWDPVTRRAREPGALPEAV